MPGLVRGTVPTHMAVALLISAGAQETNTESVGFEHSRMESSPSVISGK